MTRPELERSLAAIARDNLTSGAAVIARSLLQDGNPEAERIEVIVVGLALMLSDIQANVGDFLDLVNLMIEEKGGEVRLCKVFMPEKGDLETRVDIPAVNDFMKGNHEAIDHVPRELMRDAECYVRQMIIFSSICAGLSRYKKEWRPVDGERFAFVFEDEAV